MFKKIGISILLLMSATTAFAEANMDAVPYFGGEIGYDRGKWTIKDIIGADTSPGSSGAFGGLFAGLKWPIGCRFFLNTEIFANQSSTNINTLTVDSAAGPTQAYLRMKYSYGGSLLPALPFKNAGMVYLRIGFIRSAFYLHQDAPPVGSTSNWSKSKTSGAQLGFGLQANLRKSWAIRGEYDYVTYRTFKAFGNKITAYDNQAKIGFLYNFL